MKKSIMDIKKEEQQRDFLKLSPIERLRTMHDLFLQFVATDGIRRDEITFPRYGTTYSTSDEQVAVVSPAGIVKAIGIGKAVITVRNREFTTSKEVIVKPYR